jgi:hypothetical protein
MFEEKKHYKICIKIEGAALRVLSFLNDTNERHLASLANEKRKVTVIGEEHEPDELVCIFLLIIILKISSID